MDELAERLSDDPPDDRSRTGQQARAVVAPSVLEHDLVAALDPRSFVTPRTPRDPRLVARECVLVREELVDLPHERVCRLEDLEGLATGLGARERDVRGQVRLDERELRVVGTYELTAQAHPRHGPHLTR